MTVVFFRKEKNGYWDWYPSFINDQEVSIDEKIYSYLTGLGEEGWELVSETRSIVGWEYWASTFEADTKTQEVKAYLEKRSPGWQPRKFSPEAMGLSLDSYGEGGWEMVNMQPVAQVGDNHDILFPSKDNWGTNWSNDYFAVFKRRKYGITMRFKRPKP